MKMHPAWHAIGSPDRIAVRFARGGALSYAQLEARANQSAWQLRECGLRRGDVVACVFENAAEVFVFSWAAQRTGVYLTSLSNKLSAADVRYILEDSGARLVVVSDALVPLIQPALTASVRAFAWDAAAGLPSWSTLARRHPTVAIPDPSPGADLLYSSGTTGRPKGIVPVLPDGALDEPTPLTRMGSELYGMGSDTVYLSTSPLYHAAPLRWALTVQRLGGTVIVMERYDPEVALQLIEARKVTHATFVPTHFVRMLKLAEEIRSRYNTSSLRAAIHAAAPCPVPVKQAMLDWWGPVLYEYYSGTESCGITALSPEEWVRKPGSVGRAILGTVKILDDGGHELPCGREGLVYFADGPAFAYLNDPVKTAEAHNSRGWATLGDIGRLDEEGYLFLTDRKGFTIISGGVNIYPQLIENHLVTHPRVADAAVIGVPDEEMGEKVLAIIQPVDWSDAGEALAEELRRFARAGLGGVMTPRQFEFRRTLPREATGKLMKRLLREEYGQVKASASSPCVPGAP
jgi:acyl-CoA synthetase (AMP-forming)/AMP-acid ligase II